MLTANRDYVPLLDPSYKQLLSPAYTVYLRFLSGQRYGRLASKKVAPVEDVLSFLGAREVIDNSELSGRLFVLQIGLEALAITTT